MGRISISKKAFKPFTMFGCQIPENLDLKNKNQNCIYLGITLDNQNIGNVVIWTYSKKDYYIDNIWIKPKFRNKKYGSIALKKILNKYPKQNFHLSGLLAAKNYYIRNGFQIVKYDFEKQYIEFEYLRNQN